MDQELGTNTFTDNSIFNVGQYRRDKLGTNQRADFFDPTNELGNSKRAEVAMEALDDMLLWLDHHSSFSQEMEKSPKVGEAIANISTNIKSTKSTSPKDENKENKNAIIGSYTVAIYDATNSTKLRRASIYEHRIPVVFIESVCDDEDLIRSNIVEVKLSSPDYVGMDADSAIKDFQERIKHYTSSYDSLSNDEHDGKLPFVKLINVGQEVIVHKVN